MGARKGITTEPEAWVSSAIGQEDTWVSKSTKASICQGSSHHRGHGILFLPTHTLSLFLNDLIRF